ncbi:MAG: ImmA/IrrE family metallo-endopeptidase [Vulcanimicrobiaceae bacterium]
MRDCASQMMPRFVLDAISDFQCYVIREYSRRSDRWSAAHRLIQVIAEKLIEATECTGDEIPIEEIAKMLRISFKLTSTLNEEKCAYMTPAPGGFEAVLYRGLRPHRARFAMAHECGHALFYSLEGSRPKRIIPGATLADQSTARREEGLCNAFAGAVVLPKAIVQALNRDKLAVSMLLSSAARWKVSPETLVRRVLYDMGFYPGNAIYAIRLPSTQLTNDLGEESGSEYALSGGQPHVAGVYLGKHRSGRGPSRAVLQRALDESHGPDLRDVVRRVFATYSDDIDMARWGLTLWVRI